MVKFLLELHGRSMNEYFQPNKCCHIHSSHLPSYFPYHLFCFFRGSKWKTCRKWTVSLNPAVLSSFLWVLVHALNLQSPAKGPLGLLPKKYVSSFLSLPSFTLKLVSETMWKEVGDKVAGPSFTGCLFAVSRIERLRCFYAVRQESAQAFPRAKNIS